MREAAWSGYIQRHLGRGVVPIDIYTDESPYVDIFIDGNIADDIIGDWATYLVDEYGDRFYDSLEDFPHSYHAIEDIKRVVYAT